MDNTAFLSLAETEIRNLFAAAQKQSEFDFVLALIPEMRGPQVAGWSPAEEIFRSIREINEFINSDAPFLIRVRLALGFYCNLSEASGVYEIPRNMLGILGGEGHNCWPFQKHVIKEYEKTGRLIAPSASKIIQELVGRAKGLGRNHLVEVFDNAFDTTIRHAYAHADYVLWDDGIHVCGVHFTSAKKVYSYATFEDLVNRAVSFFLMIVNIRKEFMEKYVPPKIIQGGLSRQPSARTLVEYESATGSFSLKSYFEGQSTER